MPNPRPYRFTDEERRHGGRPALPADEALRLTENRGPVVDLHMFLDADLVRALDRVRGSVSRKAYVEELLRKDRKISGALKTPPSPPDQKSPEAEDSQE